MRARRSALERATFTRKVPQTGSDAIIQFAKAVARGDPPGGRQEIAAPRPRFRREKKAAALTDAAGNWLMAGYDLAFGAPARWPARRDSITVSAEASATRVRRHRPRRPASVDQLALTFTKAT